MKKRASNPSALTDEEVNSFVRAAESRPANLDLEGISLKDRLKAIDPFRMFLVRRHNKWLKKQCERIGVPLQEVPWWDL